MDNDTKEAEPLANERNRRVGSQYESATLQLQELLEKVKQIKINSNIPNESFMNTISEFMQSLNDNNTNLIKCKQDTQDTQATLTHSYNNALQIISQKETELQRAHLANQTMAMQLATYKPKYRIDAVLSNDDHKEQQITDVNRGNADEICTEHTEEKIDNTTNQRMDAYEVGSDCSSSSSSDCGLLTNDVTFKPVGEYEPVSFNKYIFYNQSMNANDVIDEYDGIQSDWQCTANGDLSQDETDEDEDEEDECIQFVKALNILQIKCDGLQHENGMLRNDNRQKSQMVQDIGIKYKNKCLECDTLKRKLSNND